MGKWAENRRYGAVGHGWTKTISIFIFWHGEKIIFWTAPKHPSSCFVVTAKKEYMFGWMVFTPCTCITSTCVTCRLRVAGIAREATSLRGTTARATQVTKLRSWNPRVWHHLSKYHQISTVNLKKFGTQTALKRIVDELHFRIARFFWTLDLQQSGAVSWLGECSWYSGA